jgi:FkbM family methyltransferase
LEIRNAEITVNARRYRSYLLRRTICVIVNKFLRLTSIQLNLSRRVLGNRLTFHLFDLNQTFFYFGTLHEPENVALLQAIGLESEGGGLIDAGANYGQMAGALISSYSSMILFDPNPDAATFLRNLFSERDHVRVIEAGVGDVATSGVFCIADERQSGGSSISTEANAAGPKVEITTIDEVVRQTGICPAVIKIDVEGFEERVLRGASGTIEAHHPILAWEVRGPDRFEACRMTLTGNWSFYRIDSAVIQGKVGLKSITQAAIFGSKVTVRKVEQVEDFISLIFAVHQERLPVFVKATERLSRGIRF